MTPSYSMLIQWSDEDQAYIVTLPEFDGCKTHGKTYEEAAKNGREVLELLMETCLEQGESLPDPATFLESSVAPRKRTRRKVPVPDQPRTRRHRRPLAS